MFASIETYIPSCMWNDFEMDFPKAKRFCKMIRLQVDLKFEGRCWKNEDDISAEEETEIQGTRI